MHIGTRLGAAGLAAALLLPTGALAAGPDQTQARQEDLDTLYAALQEHHPDLYANTPQEAFEAKKAEIEGRLAEESDVDFALDLQSLVALIGDSHTTTNIGSVLNAPACTPSARSGMTEAGCSLGRKRRMPPCWAKPLPPSTACPWTRSAPVSAPW